MSINNGAESNILCGSSSRNVSLMFTFSGLTERDFIVVITFRDDKDTFAYQELVRGEIEVF